MIIALDAFKARFWIGPGGKSSKQQTVEPLAGTRPGPHALARAAPDCQSIETGRMPPAACFQLSEKALRARAASFERRGLMYIAGRPFSQKTGRNRQKSVLRLCPCQCRPGRCFNDEDSGSTSASIASGNTFSLRA